MTPDIILGENKMEDLNHMIVMLKALFEHVSFQDFQKVALPLHRDTECCLHALLDGNFPPCLSPMQDIDEWQVMSAVRIPTPLLMRCSVCITL